MVMCRATTSIRHRANKIGVDLVRKLLSADSG
jgi:hypothetical protein